MREAIRAAPTETSWLVFDAEAVDHIDSTGIEALPDLTRDLRREAITLVVAKLRTRMLPDFESAGLTAEIGPSISTLGSARGRAFDGQLGPGGASTKLV